VGNGPQRLRNLPDRAEIRACTDDHRGTSGSQSRYRLAEQSRRFPWLNPPGHVVGADHDQGCVRRVDQRGVDLPGEPTAGAAADRQGVQLDRSTRVVGQPTGQHYAGKLLGLIYAEAGRQRVTQHRQSQHREVAFRRGEHGDIRIRRGMRTGPVRQVHPVCPEGQPARDHDVAAGPPALLVEHSVGRTERGAGSACHDGHRPKQMLHR